MDGKPLRLPTGETRQIKFIGKVTGDVAIVCHFRKRRLLNGADILDIRTAQYGNYSRLAG